jgi:hypothetical protein
LAPAGVRDQSWGDLPVSPDPFPRSASRTGASGAGEALAVWTLWGVVLVALVVTYARLPVDELYRVDDGGVGGALGRALVLVNFPIALVAVALVLVALDVLPRRAWWAGGPAIALCATIVLPGVMDEYDLDARPVNVVPAVGVALALGLTVAAARRAGTGFAPRRRLDPLRLGVAAVLLVLSLPWIAADLGTSLPDGVFATTRLAREDDGTLLAAVHLGHHHGWDGALLILSVLLLTRVRLRSPRLGVALGIWLGALLAYGLVNAAQDFWLEQVVKRGWVGWEIPGALRPDLEAVWLVIVLLGAAFAVCFARRPVHETL